MESKSDTNLVDLLRVQVRGTKCVCHYVSANYSNGNFLLPDALDDTKKSGKHCHNTSHRTRMCLYTNDSFSRNTLAQRPSRNDYGQNGIHAVFVYRFQVTVKVTIMA